jgi:A/G-specific adenine glycosylase
MHVRKYNLSKKILSWYDNNKRILPWRLQSNGKKKQYYRLVSEFMLQQTQVKTVIPYFKNFVRKIPSLEILSKTKSSKILKLWEGLGYYRRAKNLHKSSKIIIKEHNRKLPHEFEEIIKLPGVGDYTAKALLSFVYNQAYIPFDGNIKRIFLRLFQTTLEKDKKKIDSIINKKFYTSRNGDLAEALMEFGAIICKPINPLCNICNIKKSCNFYKNKKLVLVNKKKYKKKRIYNIFCYLKKHKKEIVLINNKNLSFLSNFKIPETKLATSNNKKKSGWTYLCNYKNNISNIKMDINLFYKFIKSDLEKYTWYSIDRPNSEFIPTFTKDVLKKISKVYL